MYFLLKRVQVIFIKAKIKIKNLKEFIDNEDHHVMASFEDFKDRHGKEYRNKVEEHHRIQLFRQNMRFIHSKNR